MIKVEPIQDGHLGTNQNCLDYLYPGFLNHFACHLKLQLSERIAHEMCNPILDNKISHTNGHDNEHIESCTEQLHISNVISRGG